MAQLVIDGGDLVVRLSGWEKFWAFHRDLRVPLTSVRAVDLPPNAWAVLRGWRMAGTGIGGFVALGTRRHGDGYDFVALHRQQPAVEVELTTGRFSRLVVSVDDPAGDADRIAAAAGIRR